MKIEHQNSADLTQLSHLIEDMTVGMLTSLDGSGALVSRPMSPLEMTQDGTIWFFTDLKSGKVGHLNPANLSFSNESKGTYVSISGYAEIQTNRARIEELWTPFARPWFPEGPDSVNIGLLQFIPQAAEYWDAPHSKMVRMFAMITSVVANKPVGLGEHNTLTGLTEAPNNPATKEDNVTQQNI